jgi:5-bromo-4-chloroindolyl phosphate hydrolysis protein
MTQDWICRSIADSVMNEQGDELRAVMRAAWADHHIAPRFLLGHIDRAQMLVDSILDPFASWQQVAQGCEDLRWLLRDVRAAFYEKDSKGKRRRKRGRGLGNHEYNIVRKKCKQAHRAAEEIQRVAMFELTRNRQAAA